VKPSTGQGVVCLVNGSLRGTKASSLNFLNRVNRFLAAAGTRAALVSIKANPSHSDLENMLEIVNSAYAIVFAFPLFAFCLPGGLMRFLEEWDRYAGVHQSPRRARVYVIVNCGFFLPETNREAIQVIRNFCTRLGLEWRFACSIGCGPAVLATAFIDVRLRKAMRGIAEDILAAASDPKDDLLLKPILPRIIIDAVRERLDRAFLKEVSSGICPTQLAAVRMDVGEHGREARH